VNNNFRGFQLSAVIIVILLLACGESSLVAQQSVAGINDSTPKWSTIEPGGDTICSDGTPYKFFVRHGSSDKLMVYFEGGGACWTGDSCDYDLKPTFYINLETRRPEQYKGIFSLDNPNNPIKDHSIVFAPYCTADVHIGDAVMSYVTTPKKDHPSHSVTVNHKGYINADAVLKWTYTHFNPKEIFVTGSSAGSIASPYYTMLIADNYPDARIAQLGDASGGYLLNTEKELPFGQWNTLSRLKDLPEFKSTTITDFNFERLYITAAKRFPNIEFAEYDTAEDEAQLFFLSIQGEKPASLLPLIETNQKLIRDEVSNFHSYIAGGELHTILIKPEFYTYQVNDVSIRDWVSYLVNGQEISDVHCKDCTQAPKLSEDLKVSGKAK